MPKICCAWVGVWMHQISMRRARQLINTQAKHSSHITLNEKLSEEPRDATTAQLPSVAVPSRTMPRVCCPPVCLFSCISPQASHHTSPSHFRAPRHPLSHLNDAVDWLGIGRLSHNRPTRAPAPRALAFGVGYASLLFCVVGLRCVGCFVLFADPPIIPFTLHAHAQRQAAGCASPRV